LVAPAGIAKATTLKAVVSVGIPMSKYIQTGNDEWLRKALLPMAVEDKNINESDLEMLKYSYEHIGINTRFPGIVKEKDLRKITTPVFIIVAEKDRMFPSKKILAIANKTIPNLKTHLLKGQGQMFSLSDTDTDMIVRFYNDKD
jgi:esterase/lipase